MCCGNEAGSYLRLVDSRITQLKTQGPSWTFNESTEEEGEEERHLSQRKVAPEPEVCCDVSLQGYLAHNKAGRGLEGITPLAVRDCPRVRGWQGPSLRSVGP